MRFPLCLARIQTALWVAFLLCISSPAWALDHIAQRSYWQDASGQMTWPEVQTQNFTPFTDVLSLGYTSSAVWMKVRITPPKSGQNNDKLILRIRPVYLDDIRLYDPLDTRGMQRVTGDQTNFGDEEYKSLTYTFVIPAGDEPRDVWLRLKTTSTTLHVAEALTMDDMLASEFRMILSYCVVLGLLFLFTILVFINWLNHRDRLYIAFILRNTVSLLYTASFFGFPRYFLGGVIDAKYLDMGFTSLVIAATGISIWYEKQFMKDYALRRWARVCIHALLACSACALTLLLAGKVQWALQFNMALNGVTALVFLFVSFFIDDKRRTANVHPNLLNKKWIITYYASITALLVTSVTQQLGLIDGYEFLIDLIPMYAVMSGLMITILMQLRARQLSLSHLQFAKDLLLSTQQTKLEKIRREEQSQLLTMLMHEIKNPLAVIDLAQQGTSDLNAKDYVARNVTIIKNILDRCLSVDRMALGKLDVQMQTVFVEDFLHDLQSQYGADSSRIEITNDASMHAIQTDYQCLQIVMNNLIDNALRYGDPVQNVTLSVHVQSNPSGLPGVLLSVANKPGLAAWPDPTKVFQKYYRSSGAQSLSGTGLGLFLVASLVTLLGGFCRYAPDDTHVRFELWLPT